MSALASGVGHTPIESGLATPDVAPELFRKVLGHLPTGVTVVTAFGASGPAAMAVNSVASLSLDPALVLFCPARTSTTWPEIRDAGRFCINVLAAHHEDLSRRFATKGVDRFAGTSCHDRVSGPGIDDAVAWIDAELEVEHDGGDHTIAVARVVALAAAPELLPLVFFRGSYGSLSVQMDGA